MSHLDLPLEIITIRIYSGDRERLRAAFPSLGHNKAIREIVHAHLNKLEATMDLSSTSVSEEFQSDLKSEIQSISTNESEA